MHNESILVIESLYTYVYSFHIYGCFGKVSVFMGWFQVVVGKGLIIEVEGSRVQGFCNCDLCWFP